MGMLGKVELKSLTKGSGLKAVPNTDMSAMSDDVTVTLSREDAENLLVALTNALSGGGDDKKKKKKKKKVPVQPPFGK